MQSKNPFAALLQTVDLAARLARQVDFEDDNSGGNFNGNFGFGSNAPQVSNQPRELNTNDLFNEYEEEVLEDGRNIRRYPNGTVRLENPTSGVMQEERPDGSLVISLPGGKLLYQRFGGEPLMVLDTNGNSEPTLAQVSAVTMPDQDEPALMFHFQDRNGTHLIEMETLRYFKVRQSLFAAA